MRSKRKEWKMEKRKNKKKGDSQSLLLDEYKKEN